MVSVNINAIITAQALFTALLFIYVVLLRRTVKQHKRLHTLSQDLLHLLQSTMDRLMQQNSLLSSRVDDLAETHHDEQNSATLVTSKPNAAIK